ncbi:MAG: hypothetical protein JJE17_03965 [Peptostreptococcaceae bacterium]|nr:hypothetical protein [Peptostreptococcaceae bacterium]
MAGNIPDKCNDVFNEQNENFLFMDKNIDPQFNSKKSVKENPPIDSFMCDFCDDAINVLKKYDSQINTKMLSGPNKNFYKYDAKGIGAWSITEPILKYLIYTNLVDKYKMLPERDFYGDKRLLDLAIFYKDITEEEINDDNVGWTPDVAIEMKWAGTRKDGNLYIGWLNQIKKDIVKMNDLRDIENKYLMLFNMNYDLSKIVNPLMHIGTLYDSMDKRKFKGKTIKLVYSNCFQTMDVKEEVNGRFYIHLYKIEKRDNRVD